MGTRLTGVGNELLIKMLSDLFVTVGFVYSRWRSTVTDGGCRQVSFPSETKGRRLHDRAPFFFPFRYPFTMAGFLRSAVWCNLVPWYFVATRSRSVLVTMGPEQRLHGDKGRRAQNCRQIHLTRNFSHAHCTSDHVHTHCMAQDEPPQCVCVRAFIPSACHP